MRLGACIAIELGIGGLLLTSACVGIHAGRVAYLEHSETSELVANSVALVTTEAPQQQASPSDAMPLEVAGEVTLQVANGPDAVRDVVLLPPVSPPTSNQFAEADAALLAPLRTAPLTALGFNHGGTSLSLRLDFEGGGKAAFKPNQIHPQSNPRRELAAYVVDRELGLGRVAPAFVRTFEVKTLVAAAAANARNLVARRLNQEGLVSDATLTGVVMRWVPVVRDARIGGFLIDSTDGVITWKRYLRAKAKRPAQIVNMISSISDMTLFDFVIDNIDRWSGSNARVEPASDRLLFMDNTMSFTEDEDGHTKSRLYLERVQVFSRRLVDNLRGFNETNLRQALEKVRGDFPHVLTEPEIAALLGRRNVALAYIDRLIEQFGADTVLAFP